MLALAGAEPAFAQSSSAGTAASADHPAAARMLAPQDRQGAKSLERRSPGKPVAPIAIDYRLAGVPQLGRPVDIELTVRTQTDLRNVAIDVRGDASLVVTAAPVGPIAFLAAGEPSTVTLTVTPMAEGSARLGVHVQGLSGERVLARSVAIPVRTGGAKPASARSAVLKVDESGQSLVVLPARETP
jgi:hypothetical protein